MLADLILLVSTTVAGLVLLLGVFEAGYRLGRHRERQRTEIRRMTRQQASQQRPVSDMRGYGAEERTR